jgi:hypothetical protein
MNNQFCGSIAIPCYSASPSSKHQSIPPDSARILLQRHVYFDPGAALMVRLDTWMWLALNTTWTQFWLYDVIMLYVQAFSNMFSSVCFCSFVATHTAQPPMTPHWSRPKSWTLGPLATAFEKTLFFLVLRSWAKLQRDDEGTTLQSCSLQNEWMV